jgi:hypothetical protein
MAFSTTDSEICKGGSLSWENIQSCKLNYFQIIMWNAGADLTRNFTVAC